MSARSGEQHRTLHEMLPMALECVKREFPDDWGTNDELCLTAAVQYARWADTAGAVEVRVPEDIDAQARSSAAFSESMLKVRCSTSSSGCEQLCCPMRTPSLRFFNMQGLHGAWLRIRLLLAFS